MKGNKMVVAGSLAIVVVLIGIFVLKGISPKEADPNYDEEMLAETEDLLPNEVGTEKTVKGSCDMINEASTCVEYFGSYWNEETINMVCQDGIYSKNGCPDQAMGGCRMNPESETDQITWHYERGGGGYNEESIKYAMQACNGVPGGLWTEEN